VAGLTFVFSVLALTCSEVSSPMGALFIYIRCGASEIQYAVLDFRAEQYTYIDSKNHPLEWQSMGRINSMQHVTLLGWEIVIFRMTIT
jgi:hypothetical protein